MSTRKLIVASLVCGLLILVAGTVKLLQTSTDDARSPNLLRVGAASTIGGLSVTVNDVRVTEGRTLVNVTMGGLGGSSPMRGWLMLADGEITEPVGSSDCPSSATDVTCTVEFVAAVGTPTIVLSRDGERRQWLGS